jgi:hypothetical protein
MFPSEYLLSSRTRLSSRVIQGPKYHLLMETVGPACIQLMGAQHRYQDSRPVGTLPCLGRDRAVSRVRDAPRLRSLSYRTASTLAARP